MNETTTAKWTFLLREKDEVDAALREASNRAATAKRMFASTGRAMPVVELANLESKISRFKFESQRLQSEIRRLKIASKQANTDDKQARASEVARLFVNLAKEALPPETFSAILRKAIRQSEAGV